LLTRDQIILRVTQAWVLLLIVGSLQPARPGLVVGLHRELHWLAFAGAAILLLALSRNRGEETRSAIAVFLLGLSLEYLQHLMYLRPFEWWDVRDDAFAVFAAFTLYQFSRDRAARNSLVRGLLPR